MDYFSMGIGFVAGMITYRMFIGLFGIGYAARFFKEIEKHCIMLLAAATESIAYIQSIKFQTMTDLKLDENTIKLTKNVDEHNFKRWKRAAITNLHESYPSMLKDEEKYYDWKTAMDFLERIYRQNRLDKK